MKLAIGRNELLKAVQSVIGAVASGKTSMQVLTFLHVQSDGAEIIFTATDLETTLMTRLDHVSEPFTTLLPAKRLYEVLRAFPDGSVVGLEEKDGKTTIKCGRSRFVLGTLDPMDFPILPDVTPNHTLTIDQALLCSLLDLSDYAAAVKDVRYYLNGVLLEMSDGFTTVSTDGHRLAKAHADIRVPTDREHPVQVIIPSCAMAELKKLLNDEDECELSFTQNQFRVDLEQQTFITKLIEGKFPDYHRVIPKDPSFTIPVKRTDFMEALNRVRLVIEDKNTGIELVFLENTLTLKAQNGEENAEEVLDIEYSGGEGHVGFNHKYLLEALKAMQSETVMLKLIDMQSSMLIEGIESEEGQHVIMPMRL